MIVWAAAGSRPRPPSCSVGRHRRSTISVTCETSAGRVSPAPRARAAPVGRRRSRPVRSSRMRPAGSPGAARRVLDSGEVGSIVISSSALRSTSGSTRAMLRVEHVAEVDTTVKSTESRSSWARFDAEAGRRGRPGAGPTGGDWDTWDLGWPGVRVPRPAAGLVRTGSAPVEPSWRLRPWALAWSRCTPATLGARSATCSGSPTPVAGRPAGPQPGLVSPSASPRRCASWRQAPRCPCGGHRR